MAKPPSLRGNHVNSPSFAIQVTSLMGCHATFTSFCPGRGDTTRASRIALASDDIIGHSFSSNRLDMGKPPKPLKSIGFSISIFSNKCFSHGFSKCQWIGLRENLQETIDFPIEYGGFPVNFPLNQSIENDFPRKKHPAAHPSPTSDFSSRVSSFAESSPSATTAQQLGENRARARAPEATKILRFWEVFAGKAWQRCIKSLGLI